MRVKQRENDADRSQIDTVPIGPNWPFILIDIYIKVIRILLTSVEDKMLVFHIFPFCCNIFRDPSSISPMIPSGTQTWLAGHFLKNIV